MSVQLQTSCATNEAPVTAAALEEIISGEVDQLAQPNTFLERMGAALSKRSTKHKFIVLATEIHATSGDLNVKLAVGTVWDGDKDGYHSFRVDADAIFMVTVYWVYVG